MAGLERSRRILITGLSSNWGGLLARVLEVDSEIEAIVGIDTQDPVHELQRSEFVRVDTDQALLRRVLHAAAIDTVIDTRLVTDSLTLSRAEAHERNVTGTRNLLVACSGPTSPVRKLVFKSSAHYYGSEQNDPSFFTEDEVRQRPPRTDVERDILAAERVVADFAAANRATAVTVLRFADVVGGGLRAAHLALLGLPVVPAVLGFDPRFQFIHEDDAIGVLAHVTAQTLPGIYNAAADGVLALSEIVSLLGKPLLPLLPSCGSEFAAAQLRRLGLPIPLEVLSQLRYGRGLDNRHLKATGYTYAYTTREAVLKLRAQQRLRPLLRSGGETYRYEREVEEFLRWSPNVRAPAPADGNRAGDDLDEEELIELISSLEPRALRELREYEAATQARPNVLAAIDRRLGSRSR